MRTADTGTIVRSRLGPIFSWIFCHLQAKVCARSTEKVILGNPCDLFRTHCNRMQWIRKGSRLGYRGKEKVWLCELSVST